MKRTITLRTKQYRVDIDIRIDPAQLKEHGRTIDLQPIPDNAQEFAMSFGIWEILRNGRTRGDSFGQCDEYALQRLEGHPRIDTIRKLCELHKRWHLNGMKAGTRAQLKALEGMEPAVYPDDWFSKAKRTLNAVNLQPDIWTEGCGEKGYSFGSAWLYEPLPDSVIAEINALADELCR